MHCAVHCDEVITPKVLRVATRWTSGSRSVCVRRVLVKTKVGDCGAGTSNEMKEDVLRNQVSESGCRRKSSHAYMWVDD